MWVLSVKLTKLAPMEYYFVMIICFKVFEQFLYLEKIVKRDREYYVKMQKTT